MDKWERVKYSRGIVQVHLQLLPGTVLQYGPNDPGAAGGQSGMRGERRPDQGHPGYERGTYERSSLKQF